MSLCGVPKPPPECERAQMSTVSAVTKIVGVATLIFLGMRFLLPSPPRRGPLHKNQQKVVGS
jgi:hypothetical protein